MPRHGDDHRGSSKARRSRKWRLLHVWGTGCNMTLKEHRQHPEEECPGRVQCSLHISPRCPDWLTFETVEADKIDPDVKSYAFDRVQPVCGHCNKQKGTNKSVLPGRSIPGPRPMGSSLGQMATTA